MARGVPRPIAGSGKQCGISTDNKHRLYPTDSAVVMVWKRSGWLAVDGFVESVGLVGDLSSGATRAKQMSVTRISEYGRHVR